jgi:hypothetical protein
VKRAVNKRGIDISKEKEVYCLLYCHLRSEITELPEQSVEDICEVLMDVSLLKAPATFFNRLWITDQRQVQ